MVVHPLVGGMVKIPIAPLSDASVKGHIHTTVPTVPQARTQPVSNSKPGTPGTPGTPGRVSLRAFDPAKKGSPWGKTGWVRLRATVTVSARTEGVRQERSLRRYRRLPASTWGIVGTSQQEQQRQV